MNNPWILQETKTQLLVALSRQAFDLARAAESLAVLLDSPTCETAKTLHEMSNQADEQSKRFVDLAKQTESTGIAIRRTAGLLKGEQ